MHELRVMCGSLLLDRVVAVQCVLYRRNYVMAGNSFKSISILNLYLCKKRKKGWLGTHNNCCYQYLQYGYELMSIFKPYIFDICWNASRNFSERFGKVCSLL